MPSTGVGLGTWIGPWQLKHFTRRPAAASGARIFFWQVGQTTSIGMVGKR
ncbi:MAG TPA: hypothetical protein VL096_05885 [Pirellulaceae bacterium]|nr:hypothetical protein [Pirellulaceae bacterium]